MEDKRKRTIIRSFRIESATDRELQEEAEKKEVSVNTLINQMLDKHIHFDKYVEEYNPITLSRLLFTSILEEVPPSVLAEIGTKLGQELPRERSYWWKRTDLDAFFSYLGVMCKYAGQGSYERLLKETDTIVILHHDLGLQWSVLFGHFLKETLKSRCNVAAKLDTAKRIIQLQFRSPPENPDNGHP